MHFKLKSDYQYIMFVVALHEPILWVSVMLLFSKEIHFFSKKFLS